MTTLEDVLNELAQRIGAVVAERLRGGEPGMVSQEASPLGPRRHCAAVKRRVARGEPGAARIGRKYLLSPDALAEELGRACRAPKGVAPDSAPAGSVRAELERKIRLVQSGRPVGG